MKSIAIRIILAIAAALAATTTTAEDYGYWKRTEVVQPLVIEVHEVRNMAVWCPKFPFARACAEIEWSQVPPAGLSERPVSPRCVIYLQAAMPKWMEESALEHDYCHCFGFTHALPTGDGWRYNDPFDGQRPDKCPVPIDRSVPVIRGGSL